MLLQVIHNICYFLFPGEAISSPLQSVDFLDNMDSILRTKFTANTVQQCIDPHGESLTKLQKEGDPGITKG